MAIDLLIISLVPRRLVDWYLDRLYYRVYNLKESRDHAAAILRDVEPMEYTEGFRAHLLRRIDDADAEQKRLQTVITYIESNL